MSASLRLTVHGDTLDLLEERARKDNCEIETEAARLLRAAVTVYPTRGRAIVLTEASLSPLETILGGGSILNEGDLQKKVERLAGISFHHLRLQFTPGQLETLEARAAREGLTVAQVVERLAPRICEQFFNL